MELEVSCGGERTRVEVSGAAGERKLRVGGREALIDWVRLPDGRYSVLLNGRVHDLSASLNGATCSVSGRKGKMTLVIRDPRLLVAARAADEGLTGLQRVCAEMPGKVIRILVREGEAVAYDQGLLVIEAMKMQNEIRAPKAGAVKAIGVEAGKTVGTGDFLVSLE